MMTTALQSIAMVMAWWILIPVLLSQHQHSCWREYCAQIHDPVGDQQKEEAALRRGDGNHGQVALVQSIVDMAGCLVCVVYVCPAWFVWLFVFGALNSNSKFVTKYDTSSH